MATNFDLSTLNLADGSYTVTIVAKGMNLKDSEQSAAASYVVEPSTVTIPSGTYVTSSSAYNFTYDASIAWGTEQVLAFTSNGISYNSMKTVQGLVFYYDSTPVITFDGDTFSSSWTNANYKTVKLDTDQTVSAEFGTWFNSNFTKQPDTVTIEAGTYVAIDKPTDFGDGIAASQDLTFTSNSESFTAINFNYPYFGYGGKTAYDFLDEYWTNNNYKTITISTPQSVSPEFGEWFDSNFTKQAEGYTVTVKIGGGDAWLNVEINGQAPTYINAMEVETKTYYNVDTIKLYVDDGDMLEIYSGTGSLANYVEGTTVTITEDSTITVAPND